VNDPMQEAPAGRGRGFRSQKRAAGGESHSSVPSLFDAVTDADEGRRRRDDGMAAALHNTDVRWKAAADQAIRDLAAAGLEFTAEDVRVRVGVLAAPPQALGALFNAARRAGTIVPVGYATATRAERHGGLLRVWRGAEVVR
jgi:hypothetical protein